MVATDSRPHVGGNTEQPDDGRDEQGRLPEPLDAAHYPPVEGGPAVNVPGMPLSQAAGTGPVVSSPVTPPPDQTPAENVQEQGTEGGSETSGHEGKTVAELSDELGARGLPRSGNKADMLARLQEHDAAQAAAATTPPADSDTATPAKAPGGMTTMPRAGG